MSEALDKFGRVLMTQVRDATISDWHKLVTGNMKGERAQQIRAMFTSFSSEQRNVLLSLVPEVVDTVLHHLLWTLERVDDVRLAVKTTEGEVASIREQSDGLAGELYSTNGWIARYSRQT